jgi:hypothetical protein
MAQILPTRSNMTNTVLRPFTGLFSFAVAVALTACNGVVVGGEGAAPSCLDCEGCHCASPPSPPALGAAIAIPFSALFPGDSSVDPNTLYLEFGNPAPTCSAPTPALDCGASYSVSIGIPPALLKTGVIQLSDPSLITTYGELGAPDGDPNNCPGGGGSFVSGAVSIESIDDASVRFTLSGTQPFDFGMSGVDGSYVATRCF